uniref:VOC domain-containing protein n=1 Tax=Periophthalmus magnuspinnatus TaxID=409849 RepID=A0A3B4AGZ5_9GOBI
MALRRALHFVFKVGDRTKTATFYRDVLGMKVLLIVFSKCSLSISFHLKSNN